MLYHFIYRVVCKSFESTITTHSLLLLPVRNLRLAATVMPELVTALVLLLAGMTYLYMEV